VRTLKDFLVILCFVLFLVFLLTCTAVGFAVIMRHVFRGTP
jgi:hypothetical protein